MTIGERIKFVRKKHGLTQVQLLTIVNKVDKRFTSYGDKAQEIATNGAVGKIDNTEVVVAPTDYFPEGVNYIIILLFTKLHFFHHLNYQNTYSTKTLRDFRAGSVKEEFILMLSF